MHSLYAVWKQKKAVLVLWALDILFFAILFYFFHGWLSSVRDGGYFAFRFNITYFLAMATSGPESALLPPLLLLFTIIYLLVRLFFLGAVFDTLHRGYPGLPAFLGAGAANFLRFLLSFFIYLILCLIACVPLTALLGQMVQSTDHTQLVVIFTIGQQFILFLAYSFFAYLYSLSRFAMVRQARFKLSWKISCKRLLAFLVYSTLGLLVLAAAAYAVILLLMQKPAIALPGALLLYLAALYLKTLLQVAAYKSADS